MVDVPAPTTPDRGILVHNQWSLISPGTERMLVEASGANLINTALHRKDLVKQVVDKAAKDGIAATVEAVRSLVATGAGIALLPDLVYRPWSLEGDRIESRDVSGSLPVVQVGLVWRRGSSLPLAPVSPTTPKSSPFRKI